jgi:hypothetical protein
LAGSSPSGSSFLGLLKALPLINFVVGLGPETTLEALQTNPKP